MSTQPDLALWDEAVTFLYNGQPEQALDNLELMKSHTSKTMFNMAMAYRLMERYDDAVKVLTKAIEMDPHLAIAYLERGIMNLKLKRYTDALRDFELGQAKLLGHQFIDYSQLGMRARLHQDQFTEWQKHCKYLLEGADVGQNTKPFETSREIAFRPPKNKIANMHKMDYLGKPKVVAVLDKNDNFSGFSGLRKNVLSKSAPSSPISMKKLIIKAEALDSPESPELRPTRPAPLPPKLQKDWQRLGDVSPMTPPPRRPVRLRKMPQTNQSDDCFYQERKPLKSPKADAAGTKECPGSVQDEKSSSPSAAAAGDVSYIQESGISTVHDNPFINPSIMVDDSSCEPNLSQTRTSPETFCLQLFCGSRHKLQLSKAAPFSDLTSAIKEVCSFAEHQIMISKENGDFMAFKTEQELKDWWSSAPKTDNNPLTVFILNQ